MTQLRLTAKQLHCFIKNGDTPDTLCERYQCTKKELRDHISWLYRQDKTDRKAREMVSALEANCKTARKEGNSGKIEEAKEEVIREDITEECTDEKTTVESAEPCTIESLEKEKERLSNKVMALESEHKSWNTKHRDCVKRLREKQEELEKIESRLEDIRKEYDQTIEEDNDIVSKMNHICKIRRDEVVALEKVRQKLDELKMVTLYVYIDGRIEAPDHPDFILDDEGYPELKKELSERPECLDLRVRDVQILARLLKISDNLGGKVSLVCDVDELETAFRAIKGE